MAEPLKLIAVFTVSEYGPFASANNSSETLTVPPLIVTGINEASGLLTITSIRSRDEEPDAFAVILIVTNVPGVETVCPAVIITP